MVFLHYGLLNVYGRSIFVGAGFGKITSEVLPLTPASQGNKGEARKKCLTPAEYRMKTFGNSDRRQQPDASMPA